MNKLIAGIVGLALVMATSGLAQVREKAVEVHGSTHETSTAPTYVVDPLARYYPASALMGAPVRTPENHHVGDITDLMIDVWGRVGHVVIATGGFLGMGSRTVALDFKDLQFTRNANDKLMVLTTKTAESMRALPDYKSTR